MSAIKHAVFGASRWLGVQAAMRRVHRRRLMVLCYHGVVAAEHSGAAPHVRHAYRNAVARDEFGRQMAALRRSYTPVSLDVVERWAVAGEPLPERAVLVTFDDGYANNLTHALPVLQRFEIPAVVSVTTDLIGTDRLLWPTEFELRALHNRELVDFEGARVVVPEEPLARRDVVNRLRGAAKREPSVRLDEYMEQLRAVTELPAEAIDRELHGFLDWDGVRALADGGVTIASHTMRHPILTNLEPARLQEELEASRQQIEAELARPCTCLVYPNGGHEDYSEAVAAAVETAGYTVAFRLMNGLNPETGVDRFAIDRVDVPGQAAPAAFDVRVCGLFSRLA